MVGYVYILSNPSFEGVKIGFTTHLEKRLRQLQTGVVTDYHKEAIFKTDNYKQLEQYLHSKYWDKHIEREFFDISEEDIKNICMEYSEYLIYPSVDEYYFKRLYSDLCSLFNYTGEILPISYINTELIAKGYSVEDIKLEIQSELENSLLSVRNDEYMFIKKIKGE